MDGEFGNSRKPLTDKDERTESTGQQASRRMIPHSIYAGTIATFGKNGTYVVDVDGQTQMLEQVLDAAGVASGFMGFQLHRILGSGTRVLVAYGSPSFIVGVLPSSRPDGENGNNRAAVGGDDQELTPEKGTTVGAGHPVDLLEGEFELANLHGPAMLFLHNMVMMKAGDRAVVEANLLNDMVRIMSEKFEHLTSLGEKKAWNNGRACEEELLTSYPHETFGLQKEEEEKFPMQGDAPDLSALDRVERVMRARFQQYRGMLGDFISSFVTDPVKALGEMTANEFPSGKSAVHRGMDGSVVIQSVADIALERVVRIPVPVRRKHEEDPELREKEWKDLEQEFLKIWDYGPDDGSEMYRTAYQLREYARWLSRAQSMARMHQRADAGEYEIPPESEVPEPEYTSQEKDRERANPKAFYVDRYATIRIMRDGSIVNHDAYGSSVVMCNGNVQVSASRHLDLEAAGDIRLVAGQNLFIKARRNIEIAASVGGLFLKSRTLLKAVCEWGSIWLRSDAPNIEKGEEPPTPENPEQDPEPEILPQAIYMEAPNSQVALRADARIRLVIDGAPYDDDSGAADETTNTSASVTVGTRGGFYVQSSKDVVLASAEDIDLKCRHLTSSAQTFYATFREVDFKNMFYASGGQLHAQGITTRMLRSTGVIQGPKIPGGSPSHENHITVISPDVEVEEGEDEEAIAQRAETSDLQASFQDPWGSGEPKFGGFAKEDYYWDKNEETTGALVESLTQQHIILDEPEHWESGFEDWNWASETLKLKKRAKRPIRLFGSEAEEYRHRGGEPLRKPSKKGAKEQSKKATWEAAKKSLFKFLRRE